MPKMTYAAPPPQRGPLSLRERAIVEIMLTLVNELRAELGMPKRTEAEAIALVQAEQD